MLPLLASFLWQIDDDTKYYGVMIAIFIVLALIFAALIYLIFALIARIPRLFKRKRWDWLRIAGGVLAVGFLVAVAWASIFNRFNINVVDVDVPVADLPSGFDGYRIAQISDLHLGTFQGDTSYVARLVAEVNAQKPDVVLFTGDIVNRKSSEMEPFVATLSGLRAKDGVFAVLGNHDYGDYFYSRSDTALKRLDVGHLREMYRNANITLLDDEHRIIRRGHDSIAIIGVQNIGHGRFPIYGSLSKAYPTAGDDVVKILMSHDPAHWSDSIAGNPAVNIHLTLSGHTHAMQIMVGGHTPASWTTPTPAGLYTDSLGRALYVNIGVGTVGMPMRFGANPEITILKLIP